MTHVFEVSPHGADGNSRLGAIIAVIKVADVWHSFNPGSWGTSMTFRVEREEDLGPVRELLQESKVDFWERSG